jgi:proton glutamate symport protein
MSKAWIVFVALIGGLLLGIVAGEGAATPIAELVGALWLNGLKMTIVPLVVALLVIGIARTAEAARAGRIAFWSLSAILSVTAISIVIGMALTPALLAVVPIPADSAAAMRAALGGVSEVTAPPGFAETLRGLIPANVIDAAARTDILPLLVFTLVFAFALTRLPPAQRGVLTGFFDALAAAMVVMIQWVLWLAPIGVFALAFVVGAVAGGSALGTLAHYIVIVSIPGLAVTALAYVLARGGGGIGFGRYARAIAPAQMLAISTQSSLACLPIMLRKAEDLGVPEEHAGVTLPMCVALLRATGPAMNVAVALYIAIWFGVEIGPGQLALGFFAAMLASLGAVSLPGTVSFFSSMVPICIALGAPVEPLALLIAVETLPDITRTLGNVTTNVAIAATISKRAGGTTPA